MICYFPNGKVTIWGISRGYIFFLFLGGSSKQIQGTGAFNCYESWLKGNVLILDEPTNDLDAAAQQNRSHGEVTGGQ